MAGGKRTAEEKKGDENKVKGDKEKAEKETEESRDLGEEEDMEEKLDEEEEESVPCHQLCIYGFLFRSQIIFIKHHISH